uniref:MADS-box domain-containing protein n=1 Tax=Glossina morsitans morsitans TaxID=37546 RepID=A0A1B0G3N4_GLOMM
MYGNPPAVAVLSGRPPSAGLLQSMSGGASGVGLGSRTAGGLMSGSSQCQSLTNSGGSHGQHGQQRGMKRAGSDCYDDHHRSAGAANGKKTKGRVKIKMEYIDNKLRRYTTFSKRKTGIMKK